MKQNPLLKIQEFGQSIWQDYIQRSIILFGELKQLIDEDGIRGVISNTLRSQEDAAVCRIITEPLI